MLIIRADYTPSCTSCGSEFSLVNCKQSDTETNSPHIEIWYCKECLNKMEEDEDNYRIME